MIFDVISPDEVIHKYKYAADKEHMIGVLADLTVSSKAEVRAFLGAQKKDRKLPTKMDREEVRRLYDEGLSDDDISERLGVVRATIAKWRRENMLPPNGDAPRKCGRCITDNRMELYEMGLNDREIADEVGVGVKIIFEWRKRNGLPPNATRGGYQRTNKKRRSNEA